MHDSLASGINAKGAASIVIRNNTVMRSGFRGASVGFDPYCKPLKRSAEGRDTSNRIFSRSFAAGRRPTDLIKIGLNSCLARLYCNL
jgi:hypothetical protein